MTATENALDNIYSPENIARSRARAATFRRMAESAHPADAAEYLAAADAIEAGADEREAEMRGDNITQTLTKGTRYVGRTTGTVDGVRVYSEVAFMVSRDMKPEPFVRGRFGTPDQDRVFIVHPHGSAPALFVKDSIRPSEESR